MTKFMTLDHVTLSGGDREGCRIIAPGPDALGEPHLLNNSVACPQERGAEAWRAWRGVPPACEPLAVWVLSGRLSGLPCWAWHSSWQSVDVS